MLNILSCNRKVIHMAKNRVIYHVKDEKNRLVEKVRIFPDVASACNFFNQIKHTSVTKPIIEDVIMEPFSVVRKEAFV